MTDDECTRSEAAVGWDIHSFKLDLLLLILVVCIAVFFRVWQQGQVPPGLDFDEAFESLEAHRIITEPNYHPIFFSGNNGVPPGLIYLTALAYLVFGEHILVIRYVSAAVGIATVSALYFLVRKLFPLSPVMAAGQTNDAAPISRNTCRLLPFAASLMLAVLPWHVAFSRRGIEVVLLPLWSILAILFLHQGITTRRWWYFVVSGVFWGGSFYTYQAAAFLPLVLILFLAYEAWEEPQFLKRYGRHLLLLALIAALVVLPLVLYVYRNSEALAHRGLQVTLFTKGRGSETPWGSLAHNIQKVTLLFVAGGDSFAADNLTQRAPIPLPLTLGLVVGCILALRHFRDPTYALLLIWFIGMLLPTLITEDAPSIRRAIGATPPMVVLISLGFGWAVDRMSSWARSRGMWSVMARVMTGVVVGTVLLYNTVWAYQYYFVDWGRRPDLFYWFDQGLVELGTYAATTPRGTVLYYTPSGENNVIHLPLVWTVRDRDLRTFDGQYGIVLTPPGPERSLYLIRVALGDHWTLPLLHEIYPGGQVVHQIKDLSGNLHSVVFAVDPGTPPSVSPEYQVAANFGDQVELLGIDLSTTTAQRGDTFTVSLFWRSLAGQTNASHTVFTHLLGPLNSADDSHMWTGHDSPPLHNSYPTTRWAKGETIVDRHELTVPADAPAGIYQLEVGLYTPQMAGARLKVLDTAGNAQTDSVRVGSISVQ